MKKKFKDTKVGKFLKSKTAKGAGDFLKGMIIDPIKIGGSPIIGTIAALLQSGKNIKQGSEESEGSGYGKMNKAQVAGWIMAILFVTLVTLYLTGVITQDEFEIINNRLNELNE